MFCGRLSVCATVINFEAQAANTGGNLTGIPDSPLTIGIASFTGGELRDGEVGLNANQTGVYASEGLFGSGETNPLVITFASPVSDFSVFVANADGAGSYTVSDNLGDSVTRSLASMGASGAATFSLTGNGLTEVDITSFDTDAWNFAIDNVTFARSTSIPAPESLLLLGAGIILLAARRHRQHRARYAVSLSRAPLAARD
ncbi:MAG TPA: PEP-CTERM sorting domain-containing protein [Bryobacteraceae bacterium]|nr:PEP-CTERM sorting domain-containing protein [Bryobacteraceae bacterium]